MSLATEIRISAPETDETVEQKLERIMPFAIWEDEAMNGDDCHQALKEIVSMNNVQLSTLDSNQLYKLAEACTAYNWHLVAGAFRGLAETRLVLGLS
jgi:hypothetical protein